MASAAIPMRSSDAAVSGERYGGIVRMAVRAGADLASVSDSVLDALERPELDRAERVRFLQGLLASLGVRERSRIDGTR
jgi:hypothetical protein